MPNPEESVIDAIDALVDAQVGGGEPTNLVYPRCRCGFDWHGLSLAGCPGTGSEGPIERDYIGDGKTIDLIMREAIDTVFQMIGLRRSTVSRLYAMSNRIGASNVSNRGMPPYREHFVPNEGDRVGYQDANGNIVVSEVAEHYEVRAVAGVAEPAIRGG